MTRSHCAAKRISSKRPGNEWDVVALLITGSLFSYFRCQLAELGNNSGTTREQSATLRKFEVARVIGACDGQKRRDNVRIADGVEMLEVTAEVPGGQRIVIHPTLVWDDETAVLIDAGMPGHGEQIRAGIESAGVSRDRLSRVIITHQDLDHIGGLPELMQESRTWMTVYAHEVDKPYIEGEQPLIKTDPRRMSEDALRALPPGVRAMYENPPQARVDVTLADGEELPYCGGIRTIFTPGHTPGHISLYLQRSKTLVAADAMVCVDGQP